MKAGAVAIFRSEKVVWKDREIRSASTRTQPVTTTFEAKRDRGHGGRDG